MQNFVGRYWERIKPFKNRNSFSFTTTKTLINEAGSLNTLSNQCQTLGTKQPMVVTDQGIVADISVRYHATQRLLINNPRMVSEADALAIYQAAY